ncbi:amino acid kinase family protein [Mesorhizobium sp. BHbsci]
MNANVLKFGGSSFLSPKDYGRVAEHIADRLGPGKNKIVAVVSAMSGTTDNLKTGMLEVNKQPSPLNLDTALATGEMLSACMLEAAVNRLGLSVMSLNGYSLGIRTNSDFGRASVESVDPAPIHAALQEHDVVVVAGAQASDHFGRLTFLGRNSSDLTAVVIASVLGEHTCEIYSDVCGIYTADPYLVEGARLIPEIAYGTIAQMSRHGAKVLHHRAVDYAQRHGVMVVCKSLGKDGAVAGTIVSNYGSARSVTVAREVAVLGCTSLAERESIRAQLDRHDISAISVEVNDGPGICITSDIDFAVQVVALAGTPTILVESSTAVTEFDSSEIRFHLERDYGTALSLARRIHERMYRGAVDEAFGPRIRALPARPGRQISWTR